MSDQETTLKRGLSLPLLIFYGVGTVLGSGVYILTGKIAGEAGMLAPFAFMVAALIAGFTGFSYAELSSRYPESAGEVTYVRKAFDTRWLSTVMGYMIIITATLSTATVARGFVGYFHVFWELNYVWIILGLNLVLGAMAIWGITQAALLITVITIVESLGIVFFIVVAGDNLADLPARAGEMVPGFELEAWHGVMGGAFLAFFTFIGFENLVNEAEEVKNPRKNLPIAIIFTLIVLTIVYMLVSMISVLAMPPEQLAEADAPLSAILGQYNSTYPIVISVICLVASVNGSLVQTVMGSRVLYGMSKQGLAPKIFSTVNAKTRTPIYATLPFVVLTTILAFSGSVKDLASYTDYIIITLFAVVNFSLLKIKWNPTNQVAGAFKVPIWVPMVGFLLCLVFLIVYTTIELL
ncbi:MAG: amino acid permease [Aureispira sp.]|nr:amino acid permease [Aureispira sp.]